MFARSPFGASFVIFTPFCRIATGNVFVGYDVNQRRKLAFVFLGSMFSRMRSSLGIHDVARWQFCSSTQVPF
eukprot:3328319-Heterocapsa_arctica.AAC.1